MKSNSGFTLIEVLVTSLLSTVVAGALLSFLYLTNNQITEGTTSLKFVQMRSVVSEQIRQVADSAHGVLTDQDPADGVITTFKDFVLFPQVDSTIINAKELRLCRSNGTAYAVYKINASNNYLEEWYKTDGTLRVFQIGSDTVFIDASKSFFKVYRGRKRFEFTLVYRTQDGSVSSPTNTEKILTRN